MNRTPRTPKFFFNPVAIGVLAVLFVSCATQKSPQGGPPDTEPPYIIDTVPKNGAIWYQDNFVTLTFNEYVDRSSVQQAVHVSPFLGTQPQFEWSGKKVRIIFPDQVLADQTYVVTVGTGVRDFNAGNRMAEAFSLAFSTGDSLDQGELRGLVVAPQPSDVRLFAYRLKDIDPDTLDPSKHLPNYVINASTDGTFIFRNLFETSYRVFAVRDKLGNFLYDPQSDEIGIPPMDVTVAFDADTTFVLRFQLHTEDTTAPFLQSIEASTNASLDVLFSEPPSHAPSPDQFHISDSASGRSLETIIVAPIVERKNAWRIHHTIAPPTGDVLFLRVTGVRDASGNHLDSTLAHRVIRSSEPDTAAPRIVTSLPDAQQRDWPVDSVFRVTFSHAMKYTAVVTLRDSAGTMIPIRMQWDGANELLLKHPTLAEAQRHELCFDLATLVDSARTLTAGDSVFCIAFTTDSEANYGSVSGTVLDRSETNAKRVVRAHSVEKKIPATSATADASGVFSIERLPAGKYLLDAFSDQDGNGVFTPGKAYPFSPAERFITNPDTLRVRARWETSGVKLTIP